jgi:hypothetical protein
VVSFKLSSLCPIGKSPQHALEKRLVNNKVSLGHGDAQENYQHRQELKYIRPAKADSKRGD